MRIRIGIIIALCLFITSCATVPPPSNTQNLCSIFRQYPDWKYDTLRTHKRWHIPIPVQMAIIYQESSFISDAKPPRKMLFGIIPWCRPTTATGYCQAVNPTWRLYQHQTGNYNADRYEFADADDFVGWYASRAKLRAGISPDDAYSLYLAYHEGITNYMNRSYLAKPWLMRVARHVEARAKMYRSQLMRCWWKV